MCPCGSGLAYDACCGALHRGERQAETPEQLMRARYAAFAKRDAFYLARTWHPRTRPDDVGVDGTRWTGLTVHGSAERGDEGTVDFTATYEGGSLSEHSRFAKRAGRWVYVDGDVA
ncbi:YchJ family protein [Microbacterium indicum]|uniref:YchJ family protein n=1 Tax=Microbacterium indicum TaxID=358100 RepID=UPI00040185FC|nr:YchJ family metal-binding protein [Microbacterium indicum]